ncbi:DUF1007 family protein [Paracoccus sp. (in: a-proteobacteria)]|uniref:DUF1007 family protein n=1 Tax=Paracoccus sp. TaxID=267 RepID=UPI0026E076FC|nr:DUF1007 family protein [Paracoccus sp. (in: a-proteobacteria)]
MKHALITAATCALLPLSAAAHPHLFIDAGVTLIYDGGDLTAVQVEWVYDDFYSLLITQDYGLDPDGDGVLTDDETAALQGFDSDWEPGFDGRLFLLAEGRRIALDPGRDFTAEYRDGQIISRHIRDLSPPIAGDGLVIARIYDPEFYVDFTVPNAPHVQGRDDCRVDLTPGDNRAAAAAYRAAVDQALRDTDATEETVIVDIGAAGAAEMRIHCGGA